MWPSLQFAGENRRKRELSGVFSGLLAMGSKRLCRNIPIWEHLYAFEGIDEERRVHASGKFCHQSWFWQHFDPVEPYARVMRMGWRLIFAMGCIQEAAIEVHEGLSCVLPEQGPLILLAGAPRSLLFRSGKSR